MSSVSAPGLPADQSVEQDRRWTSPIVWGLRVAALLAIFDALIGYQLPSDYYDRLARKISPLWPTYSDTAYTGQLMLIGACVILAGVFPYILARRPIWQRWSSATQAPTVLAAYTTTTIILLWGAALILLALLTGYSGEGTFKYAGALFFLLLLHALGSFYAGFAAAQGEQDEAVRRAGLAGAVCGLASGLVFAGFTLTYTFTGDIDANYGYIGAGAFALIFTALGFIAGRQGATLWRSDGDAAPKRVRPPAARATGGFRFQFTAAMFWGLVGLLLLSLFFARDVSSIIAYLGSALVVFAVVVGIAAIIGFLIVFLRQTWGLWAPVRRAIGTFLAYVFAIGGSGDRARSKGARRILLTFFLLLLLFFPYIDQYLLGPGTDYRVSVLSDTGYYIILALGLNIVVGFAGLLDLGYVAFFAFGAYTWSLIGAPQFGQIIKLFNQLSGLPLFQQQLIFGLKWAWLFWPTLLIGALVAAFFGVLLGAPTLRLRGDYLAIVTLGFGEIVPIFFKNIPGLTQGTNGVNGVPSAIIPGLTFPIAASTPYYYIILVLIVFAIICNVRLRDSRIGRAWVALREDEIAVAASGVNTVRTKLLAFATGAFFSGMAGAYHAARLGVITPGDFSFGDSIIYLAMVVLGGIGSIPGVMLGAVIIAILNLYLFNQLNVQSKDPSSVFYFLNGIDVSGFRNIIFGSMLVIMMLLRPEGLIPNRRRQAELHAQTADEPEGAFLDALDADVEGPMYQEQRVE
jgi:ABC-type branched-subunit amino acid transport system permease subunit